MEVRLVGNIIAKVVVHVGLLNLDLGALARHLLLPPTLVLPLLADILGLLLGFGARHCQASSRLLGIALFGPWLVIVGDLDRVEQMCFWAGLVFVTL